MHPCILLQKLIEKKKKKKKKKIECTKCSKWFHVDCEVVPKQVLDDSQAEWFCHYCK